MGKLKVTWCLIGQSRLTASVKNPWRGARAGAVLTTRDGAFPLGSPRGIMPMSFPSSLSQCPGRTGTHHSQLGVNGRDAHLFRTFLCWHFPLHLTAHLDACSCSLERLGTTLRKLEAGTEPKVGIPRMPSILPLGGTGKSERGTRELLRAEGSDGDVAENSSCSEPPA